VVNKEDEGGGSGWVGEEVGAYPASEFVFEFGDCGRGEELGEEEEERSVPCWPDWYAGVFLEVGYGAVGRGGCL